MTSNSKKSKPFSIFKANNDFASLNKRTEAALQFYEDSFMLADQLVAPFHFRYEDIDQLDKLIVETRLRMARVQTSFHRLRIYVEPSSLIEAAAEVSDAVSGVSQHWYDVILNFRQAFAKDGEEYLKSGQVTNTHSHLAGQALRQFVTPYSTKMAEGLGAYVDALRHDLQKLDEQSLIPVPSEATKMER